MARKLDRETAERHLRAGGNEAWKALPRLPDDVDPTLACDFAYELIRDWWKLARQCKNLPVACAREMTRRFAANATEATCDHRALAILVSSLCSAAADDETLEARWKQSMQTLLDLNTSYGWGSKQRRAKLRGLAEEREVLEALRAVAVGCEDASLDLLAVLAADGTDASIDALMPHLDRAENDGPRLQSLRRLRTHANPSSKGMAALLDRLDEGLAVRSERSPAVELAEQIGLGTPKLFWFSAWVSSAENNHNNVPRYQGHVEVDSRSPRWFRVGMTHVGDAINFTRTAFDAESLMTDDLELGRCEPHELPAWLATSAKHLEVEWRVHLRSNIRGKKRDAISRWLLGED